MQSLRRSLRLIILLSLVLGTCEVSWGSQARSKIELLKITVQNRYGLKQTSIDREGSNWVCRTELSPYHVSPVAAYKAETLAQIRKFPSLQPPQFSQCRDKVIVTEKVGGRTAKYLGCGADRAFANLLRETNRGCGRN